MLEPTLNALAGLRSLDAIGLGQGLSAENAQACLDQAIRPLHAETLAAAVQAAGHLPKSICIVVPPGVFTIPIEWTAIATAGGAAVHLKAPSADPALCRALADAFSTAGLDVSWSTDRDLPLVDAIIAFGGDDTVASISDQHPHTPVLGYGHRFSVAFVGGDPLAAAGPIALDTARYDTRGCMAPTAVFTTTDPTVLAKAIAKQMGAAEQRTPRGKVGGALGPEWRRRLGLARVLGQVWTGEKWAVTVTPPAHFVPSSLPRMVNIYPVADIDELRAVLSPWAPSLSTLGTDTLGLKLPGIHRECALGSMQAPPIPRSHDGRLMLAGLVDQDRD